MLRTGQFRTDDRKIETIVPGTRFSALFGETKEGIAVVIIHNHTVEDRITNYAESAPEVLVYSEWEKYLPRLWNKQKSR